MKDILVTGFETFGDYLINPAKEIVTLATQQDSDSFRFHKMIFPGAIEFDGQDVGELIMHEVGKTGAKAVVSFGFDSSVAGFRLERSSYNRIDNEKYCYEDQNGRPVIADRPIDEKIMTDSEQYIDFESLKEECTESGVPIVPEISDDPGRYCCNALMYKLEIAAQKSGIDIPRAFIHLPYSEKLASLTVDDISDKTVVSDKNMTDFLLALTTSLKI